MSNFKWMPLAGLNLTAANFAAAEKLRKFGFAINCGEFGSEKYTKSELCVYDILDKKENPNILIISQSGELFNWYRVLVTGLGTDFKIVTEAPNSLLFFNEFGASLYLISRESLFGENVLKRKVSKRFLWDLIIIDEELNTGVPDYAAYEKNIIWNSEKLLINTPFPANGSSDKAALASLIKNILDNGELAAAADELSFDPNASRLGIDTPIMRYFNPAVYTEGFTREVSFVSYRFDEAILRDLRRRVDLRSGLPVYRYGGNIFEEFDCEKFEEERHIYTKPFFTRSNVEDLRLFDKKLDALLRLCEEVLADNTNRIMIYCCEKSTLDYLRKALSCLYSADVKVERTELSHQSDVTQTFAVGENAKPDLPRIIIGMDSLGTAGHGLNSITCIVNYELPHSPALLERRMTRHGSAGESKRRFVIFRDGNQMFDAAVLDKVLFLQLANGFCGDLPARNILMDIKGRGECLNNLVKDLKYIRDFAKQVDNCLDLIKKVKCEYTIPETEKISTGKQLCDFAESMLNRLYKLFGLTEKSAPAEIAAAVNGMSGLCVINNGHLEKAPSREEMAAAFTNDAIDGFPFASEAVKGLASAKSKIDEYHKSDDFHLKIKQEITALNDCIQYPVLYGIWKYRAKEQDSNRSFKDYIKIYNDGI